MTPQLHGGIFPQSLRSHQNRPKAETDLQNLWMTWIDEGSENVAYIPPEGVAALPTSSGDTSKTDSWALGCLTISFINIDQPLQLVVRDMKRASVVEMFEMKQPLLPRLKAFYAGAEKQKDLVTGPNIESIRPVPHACDDFLHHCLKVDPAERWSLEQLRAHPFLDLGKSVDDLFAADMTYYKQVLPCTLTEANMQMDRLLGGEEILRRLLSEHGLPDSSPRYHPLQLADIWGFNVFDTEDRGLHFMQAEMQRFMVRRYQLNLETKQSTQPKYLNVKTRPVSFKIALTGTEPNNDELLKKLVLPERAGKNSQSYWASIISSAEKDKRPNRVVLGNKLKVFQLLIKEIAPQTENIIQHYAVKPENPTTELRIFTESEDAYTLLSGLLMTRRFRKTMIPGFTGQILSGLTILNYYGIVHKDIRCSNIRVDETKNIVKICHFEKASYHRWDSNLGTSITYPEGSAQFASKEMQELLAFDLNGRRADVGPATDVFSLGCTVIEMYTRQLPVWVYEKDGKLRQYHFSGGDDREVDFVRHTCALWNLQAMPDVSCLSDVMEPEMAEKAREFVRLCFAPSDERRSSEVLKWHPFVRSAL
ncbi:uncharacterized protein LOC129601832 [Paramacrobiotus metropolitanus]|uniref:uncharacterized protein LOC129601832 n=1 Tax=Paramacrobiotus metropolitanus TaxID=2943436 RepID=UPI002445BF27|nr:uncharacterized protein LOC129601832 [Paramacrobiotus metropolitanus]